MVTDRYLSVIHHPDVASFAAWLAERPEVEHVYYPGLPSHPQHDVAVLVGYPTRAQIGAFELGREALPAKRVASMAAALQCDPERLRVPPLVEYLEAME